MAEGNSLVNFGDISKPATVLIEKISNAVGILYEPRRIKKIAEAKAEVKEIEALAEMKLTEIRQRALNRIINQEERKQKNIESITEQVIHALPNEAQVENLEEDWVAYFFDKCDKVSNKQMQTLWSSLLLGEATQPGTYSKRTINIISSMDKKDAELFSQLCRFTWTLGDIGPTPLVFDLSNEVYKESLTFVDLKHLDNIGLISLEAYSGYESNCMDKLQTFSYFGEITNLEFKKEADNVLDIGKVLFTQAGKELESICRVDRSEEFKDYILREFEKQGATIIKTIK